MNEKPSFDGEQYVVMGLTTRTWYEERVPLTEGDFSHRSAPRDSSIVPHAVTSLGPELMTDYVCRVYAGPIDSAVEQLVGYIGAR